MVKYLANGQKYQQESSREVYKYSSTAMYIYYIHTERNADHRTTCQRTTPNISFPTSLSYSWESENRRQANRARCRCVLMHCHISRRVQVAKEACRSHIDASVWKDDQYYHLVYVPKGVGRWQLGKYVEKAAMENRVATGSPNGLVTLHQVESRCRVVVVGGIVDQILLVRNGQRIVEAGCMADGRRYKGMVFGASIDYARHESYHLMCFMRKKV